MPKSNTKNKVLTKALLLKKLGVTPAQFKAESDRIAAASALVPAGTDRDPHENPTALRIMKAEGWFLLKAAEFMDFAGVDELEVAADLLYQVWNRSASGIAETILALQFALDSAKVKYSAELAAYGAKR